MKSLISTLLCLIFIVFFGNGQGIRGKWMQVKIPNSISYPPINIIEISGDSIFAYDFDKLYDKGRIELLDNMLKLGDTVSVGFEFLNDNVFVQRFSSNYEQKNTAFRFVRLLPTKDKGRLADNVQNTIYSIPFGYEKMIFKLGERKTKGDAIVINDPPIATDYNSIEKFGETYFLCFYTLEYLTYAFPIKEITSDSLILYGIPNTENEVVARRVY
ncbi:hypothetical protein [Flagellimonas sp. CMM7]|uniref:hypothetical protein n=1 Tax=Flagellimonas sp. CMM7 TaxID=2654676 RepID=UPI0013D3CA29|nr:hypothetical protein [Flagellimonas sp. CMM7]UII79686.1 hypothetical protein LV704_18745 [Flagellimonas sp. CMM7]